MRVERFEKFNKNFPIFPKNNRSGHNTKYGNINSVWGILCPECEKGDKPETKNV